MSQLWRILIVDDAPMWAEAVRTLAKSLPCEIRLATNLTAGARQLARWRPQLILLDLHMRRDDWQPIPELRGKYERSQRTLAFCEQVTTHPELQNVMVVITSIEDQERLREVATTAGAHDFCTKLDLNVEKLSAFLQLVAEKNPQA